LFIETDIIDILKSRRLSWAGHVWRVKDRIVNKVTMWKPDRMKDQENGRDSGEATDSEKI